MTQHESPIRTTVIGFGLAGKVFHCPFVASVPGLKLAGIVQRSGDAAEKAYPDATIYRSAEEAINDPSVDLIVIATPNATHAALASAALKAGKHVVVDKPMAASSAEIRELTILASAAGKVLAPFHNRRWGSDYQTAKKVLDSGELGRVVRVQTSFDRYRPVLRENSWKERESPASGLLYDLGVHLLDQAIALFGTPLDVTASVRTEREGSAIDDAFDVRLTFESNGEPFEYQCSATMLAAEEGPSLRINGSLGSFVKYGLDQQEATVLAGHHPPPLGSPEVWLMGEPSSWGTLTIANPADPKMLTRTRVPSAPGDYRGFYANVRDVIRGKSKLIVTPEDGYKSIRLLEMAILSNEERRTIDVRF